MAWRVARSLETLRNQINAAFPARSRVSDGTIGDAAHASRSSDHNPWHIVAGTGVVTAMDITHDPAHGLNIDYFTDELAASRDSRIKYVIANGLILDSRPGNNPWRWMPYSGSNPHTRHFHLSVLPDTCDDPRPWNLPSLRGTTPPPMEDDMNLNDQFTDWAGNRQTVQGWMGHVDRRVAELHAAVLNKVPSKVNPAVTLPPLAFLPFIDGYAHDTAATVQQLQASVAGLTAAVAALSADEDLTRDEVAAIVRAAVRQSIEITGTVQIGSKENDPS
jgi:outer membrane murein-binding lipoprotein Lpp